MEEREYLSPAEIEERYGIKAKTLAQWRWLGKGPDYVKAGRSVLYPIDRFLKWLWVTP